MNSFTALNHAEIFHITAALSSSVQNAFVDRLIIPKRRFWNDQSIRGEFCLELRTRSGSRMFWIHLRSQHAAFWLTPSQGIHSNTAITQSPFHQYLHKRLKGLKIQNIQAVSGDRIVFLDFNDLVTLILVLIPARPEAILVKKQEQNWIVEMSSSGKWAPGTIWNLPESPSSLKAFKVRPEIQESHEGWVKYIEKQFINEAFENRRSKVHQYIVQSQKDAFKKRNESEEGLRGIEKNQEAKWGELLKSNLHQVKESEDGRFWKLWDYESETEVLCKRDPNVSPVDQIRLWFERSKRKERKRSELQKRIEGFQERLDRLQRIQSRLDELIPMDLAGLEKIEVDLGLNQPTDQKLKHQTSDIGRRFRSAEGHLILGGRSVTENLELTFRVARGNDLWFHLRGLKSAHVVVILPPKKTASLDTLLDAAQVCRVLSGYKNMGKIEVDYTQRKYVKRIKGSSLVSYTQNKTLIVENDAARIDRVFKTEF